MNRKNEALTNQKVMTRTTKILDIYINFNLCLIDFDEKYTCSIKSVAIEKSSKINLTTRFLYGKMLMFSKVSIKSFVYDLTDAFMFPNQEIQEMYQLYQVNKCYLYQNLTDTYSTSMFFVFICDLNSCVSEDKARNIIFDVTLKSKVFDRLDLLAEFYELFNCRNEDLRKRVGLFEIESIDKLNLITIALNPKERLKMSVLLIILTTKNTKV